MSFMGTSRGLKIEEQQINSNLASNFSKTISKCNCDLDKQLFWYWWIKKSFNDYQAHQVV